MSQYCKTYALYKYIFNYYLFKVQLFALPKYYKTLLKNQNKYAEVSKERKKHTNSVKKKSTRILRHIAKVACFSMLLFLVEDECF